MKGVTEPGEGAQIDDGEAVHYLAVPPGAAVYAADGTEVGTVKEMLDNRRENIFDGVVFRGSDGRLRFVDAPEVSRTAERGVTLTLSADQAAELESPARGGGVAQPGPAGGGVGFLGRIFGRGRS
jgi:hypothetical protein